jgi:murein DD-endopeptidase MepM/ murein hydrolase activator NlpD
LAPIGGGGEISPRARAALGTLAGCAVIAAVIGPLLWFERGAPAPIAPIAPAETVVAVAPPPPPEPAAASAAALSEATDAAPAAAPTPSPTWRLSALAGNSAIDIVQGPIGKRTLLVALLGVGLPRVEVTRILKAFDDAPCASADVRKCTSADGKRFDHVDPKDTFAVAKDKKTGHVVAMEYQVSPIEIWQARENDAGQLVGKKLELRVDKREVAVGFEVGDDLRGSITQAGLDDDMLKLLDDALEGHAELADVRPGARLRLLAEEERVEGEFSRYTELKAVEYTPANPQASPLRVYHYDAGKSSGYYDAKGRQPMRGGYRMPVPLARISSRFNPRRMHPKLHVIMPHNGIDFAAPPGTPVYASAAGVVRSVGDGGPCGNMVQIQHASGLVTAYCHLQRFAAGLHGGQHVEARQLVGYVGQTGRATGPHLHFGVRRGDIFIDPLALKLDGMRVLPREERDDFARLRVELDVALDKIQLPAGSVRAAEPEKPSTDETIYDESN